MKYFKPLSLAILMTMAYRLKIQNSVTQKIRILHKVNKKGHLKHKCQASEKYVQEYVFTQLGFAKLQEIKV